LPERAGRDDERALAEADGRDEVDHAPRELGPALGRGSGLELQLAVGVGGEQRLEVGALRPGLRRLAVDGAHLDHHRAAAVVAPRAHLDAVAGAEVVLARHGHADERVVRPGQVAVGGLPHEPAAVLGDLDPAGHVGLGDGLHEGARLGGRRLVAELAVAVPLAPARALAELAPRLAVEPLPVLRRLPLRRRLRVLPLLVAPVLGALVARAVLLVLLVAGAAWKPAPAGPGRLLSGFGRRLAAWGGR
jgi:hypothetical protein